MIPRLTYPIMLLVFQVFFLFPAGLGAAVGDEQVLRASTKPMVLLVMDRSHKLYHEAYNDATDLDGDGVLDIRYNPAIDYDGYFESRKSYIYKAPLKRFEPVAVVPDKQVTGIGQWSGDFLNYLTMSRMDLLRKVLYGGLRDVDESRLTVLRRAHLPRDAHSWAKEYSGVSRDGYDIRDYSPLSLPQEGTYHLFGSTTLSENGDPLLRVLPDSIHRAWEWAAKERPVLDDSLETAEADYDTHPKDHGAFEEKLVLPFADAAHLQGFRSVEGIDGKGNPFGEEDHYLTVFTGELRVKTAGAYEFAVDGKDAVEVIIDGSVVAGWYGGHGSCDCTDHAGVILLSAGAHSLEFRHQVRSGSGRYRLHWRGPDSGGTWRIVPGATFAGSSLLSGGLFDLSQTTYDVRVPASAIIDFVVRVRVGDPRFPMPVNGFERYPSGGYKPVGLLQRNRHRMRFGLLTGSYARNTAGGVLRRNMGSVAREIDPHTGQFIKIPGVIDTVNRLKVMGFRYSDWHYASACGWITDRPMAAGECRMWGNPVAEMMYEGMRYFAGKKNPVGAFTYGTGADNDDNALGLPMETWVDPFIENRHCAKGFLLVMSDLYPSFDSDQLPGSFFLLTDSPHRRFGAGPETIFDRSKKKGGPLDVKRLGDAILRAEEESGAFRPGRYPIGQAGTGADGACTPKPVSGFGDIRGLCPDSPTRQGSYYAGALAWFGRKTDLSPLPGDQSVSTYVLGMAPPFSGIKILAGNRTVILVPFAKSVGGGGISPAEGSFQPTGAIADLFIEALTPTYGKFRVSFEEVEQGGDFDMDSMVLYEYAVTGAGQVRISTTVARSAGELVQHMGYVISGTTADGTYLVVRDADTAAAEDPDYFLDTPPGQGPQGRWKDGAPLPLTAERIFTPGRGASAGFLRDPLWYAAKWGGFREIGEGAASGDIAPDLPVEWDADGDLVPDAYSRVTSPLKLEERLGDSFSEILDRSAAFVSPVVSADPENRTQTGDRIYVALFRPVDDSRWRGNLKKYGLRKMARPECGVSESSWVIVDRNGSVAVDCAGRFLEKSISFWGEEADGGRVDLGGAGAILKAAMPDGEPTDIAGRDYYAFRNIVTAVKDLDGDGVPDLVDVIPERLENADFDEPFDDANGNGERDADEAFIDSDGNGGWDGGTTEGQRRRIINHLHGYTWADGEPFGDENGSGTRDSHEPFTDINGNGRWDISGVPRSRREWVLGDIFHSVPKIIDYRSVSGDLEHRFIAVGANDGMLHLFTDQKITFDGRVWPAGSEVWAFVPGDLLPKLRSLSAPAAHPHLVDGSPALHRSAKWDDENRNGLRDAGEYQRKTLVIGQRRGGRSYWAIDVTFPDPSRWTVKWHLQGGMGGSFHDLGYTWSQPAFAKIRSGTGDLKEVAVFGGGYDPAEDGFPEAFDDINGNGRWDSAGGDGPAGPGDEGYAESAGGTPGRYDHFNPGRNEMGGGIHVVEMEDGAPVFSVRYGEADREEGRFQARSGMKWGFPADPTVVAASDEALFIWITDVYANVWRVDYRFDREDGRRWRVARVFSANPGSTRPSGTVDLSEDAEDPSGGGRKAFYSPDVSFRGNAWTDHPVLYFGTGDRAHPRYLPLAPNRFYAFSDTGIPETAAKGDAITVGESDLVNLTCNELESGTDADQDGRVERGAEEDDAALAGSLSDLLFDGAARGWYRILGRQGDCRQEVFDHRGEMLLSRPSVFFGSVFFTTYQPLFGAPCDPSGNALVYALDHSLGTAGIRPEDDAAARGASDGFRVLKKVPIASGVQILTREGKAAALFSAGTAVAGGDVSAPAGAEGATGIPGPPGGVRRILWESR